MTELPPDIDDTFAPFADVPEPTIAFSFDNLPDIPAIRELKTKRQWVAWKHEVRDGQPTKLPVNPHSNRNAKVNKPETWGSYDEAVKCALKFGHAGVGYVLIKDDDISGHDLDKVIDPVTGALPEWVQEIIDLGETYTEVSPSGRGIRMFWRGKLPAAIKLDAAQVEIYSSGRYLTVTGHRIAGTSDEIANAPKTLELLQARVEQFKEAEARARSEAVIIPASGPQVKSARKAGSTGSSPFWRNVKDAALADLGAWVPNLCGPAAVYQPGTGAWRIKSIALGRKLQEDFGIHPDGIRDFGTEKGLTAIDLVMMRNGGTDKDAAFWLCDRMRRTPESFGWDHNNAGKQKLVPLLGGSENEEVASSGPFADEAREVLRLHLEKLMASALAWHGTEYWFGDINLGQPTPPHNAIRMTVGTGKSRAIRRMIARFIRRAKLKGLPYRVLYLVSTHKLADEANKAMPDGVSTAIWQGRKAIKLGTIGTTNEPMCLNLPAVEAAEEIGAVIEKTACRRAKRGYPTIYCPFYRRCHYQAQKGAAGEADVVFAAHEILFRMPPALGEGFGLVVVDESFWPKGIDGVAPKSRLVISSLADELKDAPVRSKLGHPDIMQTMELRELIERLQRALNKMPDGFATRQQLIDAGFRTETAFEPSSCKTASNLEWQRQADPKLKPNSSAEFRQKVVAKFGFMRRIPKRARMWKALDDLIAGNNDASGRLRLETEATEEGEQRYIRVLRRKDIINDITNLPAIHLDATMPIELVRRYLPNINPSLSLNVGAKHMPIVQIAGLPVGKSSLKRGNRQWPGEEDRITRKRQRLANTVGYLTCGRRALVITYKDIEQDFAGIEGVEAAHFGAIEGIDKWKDVDVLIIIGRPLPGRKDIENMAAALTGKPVTAGDMVEEIRPIGTTGYGLRCKVYQDPDAEMIRQAVTEAAIEQAIGRVRGVNRTAADPVEVYLILSDTVVPGVPVDEVVEFDSIEPDAVDLMIMRGRIVQSPNDAHTLHPDLFISPEAARKAIDRAELDISTRTRASGHSLVYLCNKGMSACSLVMARYQLAGAGQRPRLALIDLVKFPDPRAALEPVLGPLARFEVLDEALGTEAAE